MNHRIESLKLALAAALDASYAVRADLRLADALDLRGAAGRRCACGALAEACVAECATCLVRTARRGYW